MNDLTPIDIDELKKLREDEGSRPRGRRIFWIVLLAGIVALAWYLLSGREAPAAGPALPVVTVATPLQREVTEWDDYIGRFEASRSVDLRPRVSGEITALHFRDGQFVRKGQPLFTIDQRPYRAALAEAQAGVATAQSDLALAQSDLDRALRLVADDAVSQSEIDSLRARVKATQAALAGAKARLRSRSLDMEFTTVRAPISGRISDRRVDPGNLVAGGEGPSATLLTTIKALDPLYFTFDGSEGLFLKAKRQGLARGAAVDIRLQDEAGYNWHGELDFTDNGLDPASGTIRARAIVRNPDNFLTPGMFGNMRLASGGKEMAMLVPETAILTDQTRKLLLVVDKEDTVLAKPVELGPLVDGLRVIRGGILPDDRVVIEGTQMAMPGSKVSARFDKIAPPVADAPAAETVAQLPAGEATLAN
ncbi:RND family efflux transporter MFP subunit [Altererythrobacter atlanticus]|uniref:Efflux pump periplasmic linker BepF n=1 Tax=Croceibacterium atlanticum TaxID=1267766 RepID=A0A0F7KWS1_9SPHN|nr:efflux RND transporter periplasmic adaptor subunit [Croceibacterium atlanticum]AKH44114.1 Efflux pump periplasmic linker BepF [Croceibacterium atlanticum]MBB5732424.1 RND family efflux transporter MFP subunit [Croceibacterium atlanticum]